MKKHLVLVCGIYYPQPSPTALCGERYAMLFKDEYDIDVIAWAKDGVRREYINENGQKVHILSCNRLALEGKSKGWLRTAIHRIGSAMLYLSYLGNQKWFAGAINKKLEEINNDSPIDVVFSICSPMAAHVGSTLYKRRHPNVRIVAYTVDPYSTADRIKPIGKKISDLVKYEQEVLSRYDYTFLSEEVFENRPELRKGGQCLALPYMMPPMLQYELIGGYFKEDGVHCVYAGSLYEDIRNPEYMLKVFLLLKDRGIVLHLFSYGCENIVSRYSSCPNIIVHKFVQKEQLKKIYEGADILVGIGNSMSEFLPSKTFEYVSTRKPILYFNYPDLGNAILDIYPQALQIDMSEDLDGAASKVDSFCKQGRGCIIDDSTILKSYSKYSPSNIKQMLSVTF